MSDMNKLIKGIGNKNKNLINKEENLLKILVENFFLLEEIQSLKEES